MIDRIKIVDCVQRYFCVPKGDIYLKYKQSPSSALAKRVAVYLLYDKDFGNETAASIARFLGMSTRNIYHILRDVEREIWADGYEVKCINEIKERLKPTKE